VITRISAGRASFCDQFIRVSWLLLLASIVVASANPVTGTKIDLNANAFLNPAPRDGGTTVVPASAAPRTSGR
jgi:hypothetical protein